MSVAHDLDCCGQCFVRFTITDLQGDEKDEHASTEEEKHAAHETERGNEEDSTAEKSNEEDTEKSHEEDDKGDAGDP